MAMEKKNLILEAVEANDLSQNNNKEKGQRNIDIAITTNDDNEQITIKESSTGKGNKMVVWLQNSGRVETAIVAGLTMLNSVAYSFKIHNYWNKNLDEYIQRADTSYGKHKVEHVCHIIIAMCYLMNSLVFTSCLPVFYTVYPGNFAACRQRRHGLLPFIVIHIFTLISTFNRMMLSALLTESGNSSYTMNGDLSAELQVYMLDISIDAIALFLMISFYRNLRAFKGDSKSFLNDNDIEASPTAKPSRRMMVASKFGMPSAGYVQFNDSSSFEAEKFDM